VCKTMLSPIFSFDRITTFHKGLKALIKAFHEFLEEKRKTCESQSSKVRCFVL
jgi:hypothetical protein